MATIGNLYIDAGSTFSAIITVTDTTGAPVDLTPYTPASQMRKSYGSLTAYEFTATVYDAESGKIRIAMTSAQTSQIKPGRYLYDVEISTEDETTIRVAEGIVIVTPEITRPIPEEE